MTDTRAFRGAVPGGNGGNVARGAAVTQPVVTRAQAAGPFINRAGSKGDGNKPGGKDDDDWDDDGKDDKNPKKGKGKKDDESMFEKGLDDSEMVSKQSAGSAGDFTPMKGSLADAFDANADGGENPAPNSTGVPKTPSGF